MLKTGIFFFAVLLMLGTALPISAGDRDFTEQSEVWVSSEEEFLEAIAPNTSIIISSPRGFVFRGDHANANPEFVLFEEVFDGKQLVIQNAHNLSIYGYTERRSQILAEPRYANVLTFRNCERIKLANLDCGHFDEGYCTGGVLSFENCHGIDIENCDLWGCGTEGITLLESSRLTCSDTTIRDCSYYILSLQESYGAEFNRCVMRNNREFDQLNFVNCRQVEFKNCVIYDNSATNAWNSGYLIRIADSNVTFSECAIFNNNVAELANSEDGLRFKRCTIFGNKPWSEDQDYYEDYDVEGEGDWDYGEKW